MSSSDRPRLAIVVVNYGSHELLEENLTPVASHTSDAAVVVVDNWTTVEEREAVEAQASRLGWSVVLPANNLGFGVGMNLGVARAWDLGASQALLLNPDATIDAESLRVLRDHVSDDPMTLVSPTVLRPDGSVWFAGTDLYLDSGRMRARSRREEHPGVRVEPWISGACLMVSKRLWEVVGGFSDEYFLYWEDVDLSHRVVAAGGRIAVDPDARAVHAEGGTQNEFGATAHGAGKSAAYYYYNSRNRLLYAARHLSPEDNRRWRRSALMAAYEILMQGGRRQLKHPVKPVGAVARGTVAGMRFRVRLR